MAQRLGLEVEVVGALAGVDRLAGRVGGQLDLDARHRSSWAGTCEKRPGSGSSEARSLEASEQRTPVGTRQTQAENAGDRRSHVDIAGGQRVPRTPPMVSVRIVEADDNVGVAPG